MKKSLAILLFSCSAFLQAQTFDLIPLGIYGGGDESNLSSYLVGAHQSNQFLALDAGTIRAGILKATSLQTFTVSEQVVLQDYIKGYFISHGHLDHLSGLIINSPDDRAKPIYALPFVIEIFKNNYFTNASWANFGSEGEAPILGTYSYERLTPKTIFSIQNTDLTAEVYELSHVNPQQSSALVVSLNGDALVYLGDTGADRVERSNKLNILWERIAPLVATQSLKALLIEVSFPNSQPENKLFGHLTPNLLVEELHKLEAYNGKGSLEGLNIMITHLKPNGEAVQQIKTELEQNNQLGVHFIFPEQGKRYEF